ncbi:MAG: hypothetical protein JW959_05460 [Pirellulales bacterium]|nr:hypothetical protein [Pirellulales bacterium]
MTNRIETTWELRCDWPLPPWAVLLAAVAAVVFVVLLYLKQKGRTSAKYRVFLAAVRSTSIVIALLMLGRLTLVATRVAPPSLDVLIDDSLSMNVVDRMDDDKPSSRWKALQSLLGDGAFARKLAESHRLRPYFLTELRPAADLVGGIRATGPTGRETRLGEALMELLDRRREAPAAAIVVFSDGINTAGPAPAEAARRAATCRVPLYFIAAGGDRPAADLEIADLAAEEVIFLGDVVTFECRLKGIGCEKNNVSIALREKNNSALLAEVRATVGPDDQSVNIRIPYRPERAGRFEYVVEAAPLKGELHTENNRLSRIVEVRAEKVRVLLVQAHPSYEFRYLRNLLQRDKAFELHTVLQDADPRYAAQDAAALAEFPSSREELFAYDAVVLGDADPALLGPAALENLAAFVDRPSKGGGLALIAGPKFMPAAYRDTPLRSLLPFNVRAVELPDPDGAIAQGFVARPTPLGLANPGMQLGAGVEDTEKIWSELPPLYWLLEVPEPDPAAQVLLEHPARLDAEGRRLPVVLFQYAGAGKVLFLATDETWRWRRADGGRYYARFWLQTIRWLCRSKLADAATPISLAADRYGCEQGKSAQVRLRFADERLAPAENEATVIVEAPDGKTERLALRRAGVERGLFEGRLRLSQSGKYRLWPASPQLKEQTAMLEIIATPPAGEMARTRLDAAEMRRAAEISGGRYFPIELADELFRALPPGRPAPVEALPPLPLWNRWPLLALFLGLLIAEWLLRKLRGMV